MLDYKGVEALAMVIAEQNFERAAQKLFITQSAISQRIRGLENFYGTPMMVRTLPYRPTELGQHLIGHFNKVTLLEEEMAVQITEDASTPKLSIGLNRDSLETWFLRLVLEKRLPTHYLLDIVADDQELLLSYFKSGHLAACMSPSSKQQAFADVQFLGFMDYLLVASPAFKKEYFSRSATVNEILKAPALQFDKNDSLHKRCLERFFGIKNEVFPSHFVPSVRGFKSFTLNGLGYALLPKIDIEKELQEKALVEIAKDLVWQEPVYWHYVTIRSNRYQEFMHKLMHEVKQVLRASSR